MGRPRLSDEEKKLRAEARKAEKKAQKEAERKAAWEARRVVWAQQAAESREKVLNEMSEELRQQFEAALAAAKDSQDHFVKDIAGRWEQYGNLSERQINALITSVARAADREIAAGAIELTYDVGDMIKLKGLKVHSVQTIEVETPYGYGTTRKITMVLNVNNVGIRFTVKTNNEKLVNLAIDALENDKMVTIEKATIKWHYEGSDTVILTSRGMRLKID